MPSSAKTNLHKDGKRLRRSFFARPTLTIAKDLLGKLIIRKIGRHFLVCRITETEAYRGEDDLACHASRGRTQRTEPLYGIPGTAYVYLIYGMYHCFNIVTERKEFPSAVLIRGCIPVTKDGDDERNRTLTGPGRLCRELQITKTQNGVDLTTDKKLWIADDGRRIRPEEIQKTPRIGVDYAKHCATYPWRFVTTALFPLQEKKNAGSS